MPIPILISFVIGTSHLVASRPNPTARILLEVHQLVKSELPSPNSGITARWRTTPKLVLVRQARQPGTWTLGAISVKSFGERQPTSDAGPKHALVQWITQCATTALQVSIFLKLTHNELHLIMHNTGNFMIGNNDGPGAVQNYSSVLAPKGDARWCVTKGTTTVG